MKLTYYLSVLFSYSDLIFLIFIARDIEKPIEININTSINIETNVELDDRNCVFQNTGVKNKLKNRHNPYAKSKILF